MVVLYTFTVRSAEAEAIRSLGSETNEPTREVDVKHCDNGTRNYIEDNQMKKDEALQPQPYGEGA